MSNDELRNRTTRLSLENNYQLAQQTHARLNPQQVSTGKKFVSHVGSKVIIPAATEARKECIKQLAYPKRKSIS